MICPECKTSNREGSKFCLACGAALPTSSGQGAPMQNGATTVKTATSVKEKPAPAPATPRPSPQRAAPPTSSSIGTTRIDRLGTRSDGWAALIDDMGDQAGSLFNFVRQRLAEREMPQAQQQDRMLTTGGLAGEKRTYHLALHHVGATVAIYINRYGRDLYVAWDLFVKEVWKIRNLLIILGVSFLLRLAQTYGGADVSYSSTGGSANFTFLLAFTGIYFILLCLLVGIAGLILKRNFWAFLKESYNHFRSDDLTAMMMAVHHSIILGLNKIGVDEALVRPKEQFQPHSDRII